MGSGFEVDTKSGVPIYVQLVEQVKRRVGSGSLGAGDRLPTVRALAGELSIAPNTIVKAYNELQGLGLIESKPGVGTVISPEVEAVSRRQRRENFDARLRELVREAVALGVSQDELWEAVDREFDRSR